MIIAMLHKNLKNEEDAFYCYIYIMEKLHWKLCFCNEFPKLKVVKEILIEVI
jgi:hypothetical protein